jgi:hypothetical protein
MAYRPERGWGFSDKDDAPVIANELEDLRRRVSVLERNVSAPEKNMKAGD